MTPENFAYWLQGYFEISGVSVLDEAKVQIIKDHLDLVFSKITPERTTNSTPIEIDWDKFKKTFEEDHKHPLDVPFTGSKDTLYC